MRWAKILRGALRRIDEGSISSFEKFPLKKFFTRARRLPINSSKQKVCLSFQSISKLKFTCQPNYCLLRPVFFPRVKIV